MTDMTAFEQQLAAGFKGLMGPSEPVDDGAIFTAITATQSPAWRVRPLFSATRFVVAGVIVALFSAFLLAGLLTSQQDDEVAPAAVTQSPSPMTTEEMLSGMITEEVEPRVRRVVDDGVRDLSGLGTFGVNSVAIAPDGVVWVCSERTGGLFRLGEAEAQTVGCPLDSMIIAADGSVWLNDHDTDSIRSFDGATWAEYGSGARDGRDWRDLSTGPDGTVWAVALDTGCSTDPCYVPVQIDADGAITDAAIAGDIIDQPPWIDDLAVAPDGNVWMTILAEPGGWDVATLLRYDATAWEAVAPPEGTLSQNEAYGQAGQALGFAPDGTLWIGTSYTPDGNTGLARLDDSGWTVFSAEDGVRPWGTWWGVWVFLAHLQVAPDGSVWVNAAGEDPVDGGCGGIARFDGVTWTTYLAGTCVHDLDIAPDGAVWVAGASVDTTSGGSGPVGLFVITPEASETTD